MRKLALLPVILFSLGTSGYAADFSCASGNVGCLISAIEVANANGEDNSIFLEIGEYALRTPNAANLVNGLPAITGRIRISGPKGTGSTIERDSTAPGFRIFEIAAGGNVVLDWLGIRNGQPTPISNTERSGGAILNAGSLTINRTAIYKNRTDFRSGGAICSTGKLTINNSEITRNIAAVDAGGAIFSSGNDGACSPRDHLGDRRHGLCDIGAVGFRGIQEDGRNGNKHRISQNDRLEGNQPGSTSD